MSGGGKSAAPPSLVLMYFPSNTHAPAGKNGKGTAVPADLAPLQILKRHLAAGDGHTAACREGARAAARALRAQQLVELGVEPAVEPHARAQVAHLRLERRAARAPPPLAALAPPPPPPPLIGLPSSNPDHVASAAATSCRLPERDSSG